MTTLASSPGTVTAFDEAVGLGELVDDDGRSFRFHCVAIADGSRTIAVGARVRFHPLAKLGSYEATAIQPA